MALKKSDLYSSLWRSCDELRGGMDASQYKDYVLTLLFVKFVTDRAKLPGSLIEVPDGGTFDDMVDAVGDSEIGDRINKIIGRLADANDLRNVIDLADFNDDEKLGRGKEMQDRLSKLVAIFNDLDFSGSQAEGDDLLGDAYEFLMRHFATESGKSKGQFYTPAEVSRILSRLIGITNHTRQDQTAYDPTCGSGSLLIKVADEAPRGLTIYGQEKDNATWALARMNAILHSYEDHDIRKGDTITSPEFTHNEQLQTFDFVVANPPFSVKSWANGLENSYGRFDDFGRPPDKNGDYAFLLHVVRSMKSTGKAAVILPHGVLFRGNAEHTIRRNLIRHRYIKGIIGLPPNLFFGTGIPACIIVLDKQGAAERDGIFMIDASAGYIKDGAKNRLRSRDIHQVVDVFNCQAEVERFSRMVPLTEIESDANDFNLNIARYIDSSEPEDLQDLHAHLHGGIPERDIDALAPHWEAFPSLRDTLFTPNRDGYLDPAIEPGDVRAIILGSEEFKHFADAARDLVGAWFEQHRIKLAGLSPETRPQELIGALGDDLLARFAAMPLIDEYAVYEELLNYWHSTMHDDVVLVMHDGWVEASRPRSARIIGTDKNGKPKYEDAHIKLGTGRSVQRYVMDLIPPDLIVGRFFSEPAAELDRLVAAEEKATTALSEYVEEHAVEDRVLWPAIDDNDKVTQKSAKSALADARADEDDEAVRALERALGLIKAEGEAKLAVKDARAQLDRAALLRHGDLTENEVVSLLLDAKWNVTLTTAVNDVVASLVLNLVARIEELGDRYGETMASIEACVAERSSRVEHHLNELGVA